MKVIFVLILAFLLCNFSQKVLAQNDSLVTSSGYLVHVLGGWCFQPCEDSSVAFWDALDGNSFNPGTFARTFGSRLLPLDVPDGLGEREFLTYNFQGQTVQDTICYFYCSITLNFKIDPLQQNDIFPCNYELIHNSRNYGLCCKYYQNIIEDLKPASYRDKLAYIRFLKKEEITFPEWGDQFILKEVQQ